MPNINTIEKEFSRESRKFRSYFRYFLSLTSLIRDQRCSWDVVIAYLFSKIEQAHRMTLYCGVVNKHRVNATVAKKHIFNEEHLMLCNFYRLCKKVFGQDTPKSLVAKMKNATKVRNKILHGKTAKEAEKRQAVMDILTYSKAFNAELQKVAGFKPFGDRRGVIKRGERLDQNRSKQKLKKLGFKFDINNGEK